MNSLKAVLNRILQSQPSLQQGVQEAQMLALWPQAVGPLIAKHTRAAFIKNKTAFIEVDSPVWKQELFTNKTMVLKKLNQTIEKELGTPIQFSKIEDLFFLSPRDRA